MSRTFCIPGILFLVVALILSFLVSVSLPFLPAIDIVRTNFQGEARQGTLELRQFRVSFDLPTVHAQMTHEVSSWVSGELY